MIEENCPYYERELCKLYSYRNPCVGKLCGIYQMQEKIEEQKTEIDTEIEKKNSINNEKLFLLRLLLQSNNGTIVKYANGYIFQYREPNGKKNRKIEIPVFCNDEIIEKYFFDINIVNKNKRLEEKLEKIEDLCKLIGL